MKAKPALPGMNPRGISKSANNAIMETMAGVRAVTGAQLAWDGP